MDWFLYDNGLRFESVKCVIQLTWIPYHLIFQVKRSPDCKTS